MTQPYVLRAWEGDLNLGDSNGIQKQGKVMAHTSSIAITGKKTVCKYSELLKVKLPVSI